MNQDNTPRGNDRLWYRILQIMPSGGWEAVFEARGDGPAGSIALVCWALVEDEDGTHVEGLTGNGYVTFCSDARHFIGYHAPTAWTPRPDWMRVVRKEETPMA